MVALEAAWLSLLLAGCLSVLHHDAAGEWLRLAASFGAVFALCGTVTLGAIVLSATVVATSRVRR